MSTTKILQVTHTDGRVRYHLDFHAAFVPFGSASAWVDLTPRIRATMIFDGGTMGRFEPAVREQIIDRMVGGECLWHACAAVTGGRCACAACMPEVRRFA